MFYVKSIPNMTDYYNNSWFAIPFVFIYDKHCTSEHHSSLVALSEATRRAIFPPYFVHNAVISPSTQITVMAC